jgi:hypothetical protein
VVLINTSIKNVSSSSRNGSPLKLFTSHAHPEEQPRAPMHSTSYLKMLHYSARSFIIKVASSFFISKRRSSPMLCRQDHW